MSNPLLLIGAGLVALSFFMLLFWLVAKSIDNFGIVDVAWALGFSLAALIYSLLGQIYNFRHWLIVLAVVLSSLRLTWHLGARFLSWYPKEDPRYKELRSKLGDFAKEKMLVVYLWQAIVLALMTAPLAVALADPRDEFSGWQAAGVGIWLVSLIGESLADYQLSLFTRDPANRGRTCQKGLWRYSRHPNYFFEWLGSVAFFLYVLDSPYGIWTILCPLLLLHLLLNVTGVKPSEEHSLRSRSDYAEYKRKTSVFVPWFRRTS
jgi:steroid 5-alpha reductase family enzyme